MTIVAKSTIDPKTGDLHMQVLPQEFDSRQKAHDAMREDGPSWCEAAIYYADEDVVTSEPYNSFYNHWVCQTANATYHLYMGVADTE